MIPTRPSQPSLLEDTPDTPLFQVAKGDPDAVELAALTAVVLALAGGSESGSDDDAGSASSGRSWARRNRLRLAPAPGPGSWRRSAWR